MAAKLTKEDLLRKIFEVIDIDGNKVVSKGELKEMVMVFTPKVSEQEFNKIFDDMDKVGESDSRVTFDEFSKYYMTMFKNDTEQQFRQRIGLTLKYLERKPLLTRIFKRFDTDGSGNLNKRELYRMVKINKPDYTLEELSQLFSELDFDKDNKISEEDFVRYYFNMFRSDPEEVFLQRVRQTFEGRRRCKLQEVFDMYDTDGNGYLDVLEFSEMLKKSGNQYATETDVLEALQKFGVNVKSQEEPKLSFDQWMNAMGKMVAYMDDERFNRALKIMKANGRKR